MNTGYGGAAITGGVIALIGCIGGAFVAAGSAAHSNLWMNNLFLLCAAVVVLGVLVIVTAGISYAVCRSRRADLADQEANGAGAPGDQTGEMKVIYINANGEPQDR